jgi:hypothetical protein
MRRGKSVRVWHWTLTDASSGAITDQRAALGLEIDKIRGVAAAVVKQRAFSETEFNTGGKRSKYRLVVSHAAEEIGGGPNAVARAIGRIASAIACASLGARTECAVAKRSCRNVGNIGSHRDDCD